MSARCIMVLLATLGSVSVTTAGLQGSRAGRAGATDSYMTEVERWRAKHEADYRRENVPLAGLFFLKPGGNTVGSGPHNDIVLPPRLPQTVGRFVYQNQQVTFEPGNAPIVSLNGGLLTGPVALKSDEPNQPDELTLGDIALWVHESGPRRAIRMRDPQSDAAKSFLGFHWFPVDPRHRVVGRFIRDPSPRKLNVPSLTGDDQEYTTEGVVEFIFDGQKTRLRPMTTRPGRLYFVFRDGTSGHETYEAARFLYSDLLPDGTTVLDFNEAYNPPCAFNQFTTCPLPLPENRLTVRILAGEKAYPHPPK